ncbi:hypothetical protein [Nocardioides pakistanensis]
MRVFLAAVGLMYAAPAVVAALAAAYRRGASAGYQARGVEPPPAPVLPERSLAA